MCFTVPPPITMPPTWSAADDSGGAATLRACSIFLTTRKSDEYLKNENNQHTTMAETEHVLLEFLTETGARKQTKIPLRLLATDGPEVIRRLKAAGVTVAPGADDLVLAYLTDQITRLTPNSERRPRMTITRR